MPPDSELIHKKGTRQGGSCKFLENGNKCQIALARPLSVADFLHTATKSRCTAPRQLPGEEPWAGALTMPPDSELRSKT